MLKAIHSQILKLGCISGTLQALFYTVLVIAHASNTNDWHFPLGDEKLYSYLNGKLISRNCAREALRQLNHCSFHTSCLVAKTIRNMPVPVLFSFVFRCLLMRLIWSVLL